MKTKLASFALVVGILAFAFWPLQKDGPWIFAVQCEKKTNPHTLTWWQAPETRAEIWWVDLTTGYRMSHESLPVPDCDAIRDSYESIIDRNYRGLEQ